MHENPWRASYWVGIYRDELAAANDRQADLFSTCMRLVGAPVRRSLLGSPIARAQDVASKPGALPAVLDRMREAGLVRSATPSLARVPEPVQQATALILTVAMEVLPLRRAGLQKLADVQATFDRGQAATNPEYNPDTVIAELDDFDNVDLQFIGAAAQDLAAAGSAAKGILLGVVGDEKYSWRISTTWGEIVLSGGDDTSYENLPAMLIIDTGGNDTYIGLPANRNPNNWLSIVLDSAGNDKYLSSADLATKKVSATANRASAKGFGPAAATLGYAFLYDVRGNDLYRSTRPGISYARFGASAIVDSDGNDIYDLYADGQAAATAGYAIIEDMGGTDTYECFTRAQGYGGTLGCGALIDRGGNDTYTANNTQLDFPSPQSAQHNVSMAQGVGFGRRADFLDGHSLSGGIGILYDLEGTDKYSCGVFGQGCGYWEGVGLLLDRVGSDTYTGQWYVQGASAHFAIGYLEDENGEDTYNAALNMAQGAGHDFGTGFLIERNGNDQYSAPNLSLGASSANGIGLFMDFQGDDTYKSLGLTLGRSGEAPKGTIRERALGLGLFYDGMGTDQYPESATWARNGARVANWTDRQPAPAESQLGIFWDR